MFDGGGHLDLGVDEEVSGDVGGVELGEFGDLFGGDFAVLRLPFGGILGEGIISADLDILE